MKCRQDFELIEQLKEDTYITAEKLAVIMKVSPKTIRKRIQEWNDIICEHGGIIESKPRYGYRLKIEDSEKFSQWKSDFLISEERVPDTKEERIQYLLAYLLSHEEYIKLDNLSEFLYVSKTTLTTCLRQVEEILNKYKIVLERRPNYGIRAVGEEFDIRLCMRYVFLVRIREIKVIGEYQERELKNLAELVLSGLNQYKIKLSEIALKNFIDDIYIAIRRMRSGHYIELSKKKIYGIGDKEWEFVRELSRKLEELYQVSCTEGERFYIALHLAGKQTVGLGDQGDENMVIIEKIDRLVIRMLDKVYEEMKLDFRNNFDLRMSLNQHMVPLDIRLRYDIPLENPLLEHIRGKYTLAYEVALQACSVLQSWYKKRIPQDEVGYFALIFALALEQQGRPVEKSDILIVCSSGKGTSRLLKYRYMQKFGEYLGKIYTSDLYELGSFDFSKVDYVFTTVPISISVPRPILEVGLFLEQEDIDKVRKVLESGKRQFLHKYFNREHFLSNIVAETKEDVLKQMCAYAVAKDGLPDGLYDAVMRREDLVPTDLGNRIALPHPDKVMTEHTHIYVGILKEPVFWSIREVQIVILAVIGRTEESDMQEFYETVSELILNPDIAARMTGKLDYDHFIEFIKF